MSAKIRVLSLDEQKELEERLKLLLTEGKRVEGTSPSIDISMRPGYFDEKRFEAGQKAINKYYLSLSMSATFGLLLLLQLEEILIPLLRTGKSRTIADLYDRYSATGLYLKRCYESRFYDPSSEGWHYVNMVRAMHQRIFRIMNHDHTSKTLIPKNEKENSGYVWVNQYDMALTQFAFVGLLILEPGHCGKRKISLHELGDLIYFWRMLSYQLGIEDRFNVFVYHDDLAKQISYMKLIFNQYQRRLSQPRLLTGVKMAEGVLLAFEDLSKEATPNIIHNHWLDVISLTGSNELAPYEGLGELWKLAKFKLAFKLAAGNSMIRASLVQFYKKKFEKFCTRGDKIKKKLGKKHPEKIFELEQITI